MDRNADAAPKIVPITEMTFATSDGRLAITYVLDQMHGHSSTSAVLSRHAICDASPTPAPDRK